MIPEDRPRIGTKSYSIEAGSRVTIKYPSYMVGSSILFYLYIICAPAKGDQVTLKYYSSVLKNIFTAEPFTFADGTRLGTNAQPYTPVFY